MNPVNDAPAVANPLADQTSAEDAAWSFALPAQTFSDVDNASLMLSAALANGDPLPSWLTLTGSTLAGTPPANFNGALAIKVTASDGALTASDVFTLTVTPVSDAPTAPATGALSVPLGAIAPLTPIGAHDVEGDALTYSLKPGAGPAKGLVEFIDGGYVYASNGPEGGDAFTIVIDDGHGGRTEQVITVTAIAPPPPVTPPNSAPTLTATQAVTTLGETAIQLGVAARDADGDPLTYTASAPAQGVVRGGADGAFVYTPAAGFLGEDSFIVTVSDGKGGAATQRVAVSVIETSASEWRMFAGEDFAGTIGGSGGVIGGDGRQDMTVLDLAGRITFDASFARGGDAIRLTGDADAWRVMRSGSNAVLSDGDTFVVAPVGEDGLAIHFADGARLLQAGAGGGATLGGQALTTTLTVLTALAGAAPLAGSIDADARARLFMEDDGAAAIGGDYTVIGGDEAETVTALFGAILLDTSFNRGGDTLILTAETDAFTGQRSGSNLVLIGADVEVVAPVGMRELTVQFADDARLLTFDIPLQTAMLGTQAIGVTPVALAEIA